MADIPVLELSSGVKMPIHGLGTWLSADDKCEGSVEAALELGYKLIDTAYVYRNEHIVGRVLKRWFDSGKLKREDIFVTTKLPIVGNRRELVEKYMKKSLENLGLDYVDLYLIHHPCGLKDQGDDNMLPTDENGMAVLDKDIDLVDVWKGMEEQVAAGRTRAIGVSNFNVRQLKKLVENSNIRPANNQVEMHAYLQQPELVKYCEENNIIITSYATLGSPGRGSFTKALNLPDADIPDVMDNPAVTVLAEKYKKTPAQVLLRFFIQKKIAVIPKSVTPSRIKENLEVFDFNLSDDEIASLNALDKGPKARTFTLLELFRGVENHPEYPYPECV